MANTPSVVLLPFREWGAFATDLVLNAGNEKSVAREYQLNEEQLQAMLLTPSFQELLQAKQKEVEQLGSTAEVVLSAREVLKEAFPALARKIRDPETSASALSAIIRELGKIAQVYEEKPTTNNQCNVVLNIDGLPDLPLSIAKETRNANKLQSLADD